MPQTYQRLISSPLCSMLYHTDGLMQERRNFIANALELRLSCTNQSIHDLTLCLLWQKYVVTLHSDMVLTAEGTDRILINDEEVTVSQSNGFASPRFPGTLNRLQNSAWIWRCNAIEKYQPIKPSTNHADVKSWGVSRNEFWCYRIFARRETALLVLLYILS